MKIALFDYIVKLILKELKKSEALIQFVTDRLGHDRRYAMDASKIKKELGGGGIGITRLGHRDGAVNVAVKPANLEFIGYGRKRWNGGQRV